MPSAIKNILIIKPSSLGDIILALPALMALRKSFPDAKISWLIRPEFAGLLENHPHLTQVIPFDRKFLAKAWFNPYAFFSLLSLIRTIRCNKFDVIFDFQGLFRTASLAWLSGCKNRYGLFDSREFAHLFYTDIIEQTQACTHLVDYYLKVVKAAGAIDTAVQFVLPDDRPAADSIKNLLKSNHIEPDNYAVLIPGSAQPDKRWPIERFAELADRISSDFNFSIVAVGTAPEADIVEKLKTFSKTTIANLAGRTSLKQLTELLKTARLVVTNDTGPGHIAAALSVPLVMIFGWSNPLRLGPYRRKDCVVAIEPDKRGTTRRSSNPNHDIKAITVDDVYKKVCQQLKSDSSR
jgi:lipopolysaccharide heptosyltransferase I